MLKFLTSMKMVKKKQASRRRKKRAHNCTKLEINVNMFCFVLLMLSHSIH